MSKKLIYITDSDMKRLRELVKVARDFNQEDERYLKDLEAELHKGKVVKSGDIPQDVITMNSKACLKDMDSNEDLVYWLVFPDDADSAQNKISVLTPIGTALLGYKVGDVIERTVPAGLVKLKVQEIIYQPEAAGDFHL